MPDFKTPGVYVEETAAAAVTALPTAVAAFVGYLPAGPAQVPTRVGSAGELQRIFGGPAGDSPLSFALDLFFRNGGSEALVVRLPAPVTAAEALIGQQDGVPSGLGCLADGPVFTLLALPDCAAGALPDAAMRQVWEAALALCAARRAFLILDLPGDVASAEAVAAWRNERLPLQSRHGAAYCPWLRIADPAGGERLVPPSGAIAGLYARIDATRGVWKAPAGSTATLTGLLGLAVEFDSAEQDRLNPLGVNLLRRFASRGLVCFGARTLDGFHPDWRYVPVRRLADHIEESLRQGLAALAFEANGEPAWAQVRLRAGAFLHDLFRQGAFAGRTADDSYFVRCDATTMTPEDLAQGRLVAEIGFAPLKPAEFVMLRIGLCAQPGGNPPPP